MEKIFDLNVANPVASKAIEACLRVFYKEEEHIPEVIYSDWYSAIVKGSLVGLAQQIEPMYAYLQLTNKVNVAEALASATHVVYRYNTLLMKDRAFDIMNKCREVLGELSGLEPVSILEKYQGVSDA